VPVNVFLFSILQKKNKNIYDQKNKSYSVIGISIAFQKQLIEIKTDRF
jgi:hypothetical protein